MLAFDSSSSLLLRQFWSSPSMKASFGTWLLEHTASLDTEASVKGSSSYLVGNLVSLKSLESVSVDLVVRWGVRRTRFDSGSGWFSLHRSLLALIDLCPTWWTILESSSLLSRFLFSSDASVSSLNFFLRCPSSSSSTSILGLLIPVFPRTCWTTLKTVLTVLLKTPNAHRTASLNLFITII